MRLGVVQRITVCLSIRRQRHIGVVSSFWRSLQTFVCRAWFFCVGLLCEEGHGVRGSRGETGRRLLHESGPTAMAARTRVLARGAERSEPAGHVEAQGTAARAGPGAAVVARRPPWLPPARSPSISPASPGWLLCSRWLSGHMDIEGWNSTAQWRGVWALEQTVKGARCAPCLGLLVCKTGMLIIPNS